MDIKRKSYPPRKQAPVLSSKAIKDFQEAYFLDFGIKLTPEQAQSEGLPFLQLMKHLLKPIPISVERKNYEK